MREREAVTTALVPAEELKAHLPGVEPERRLNDWGRSERIEGIYDRTVAEFFYRYWFRAEVEGIENVPAAGGALLVSNHSGALPPDAAMIAKAQAQGIVAATIIHPWNEEIVASDGVIGARDWRGLKTALEPVLHRLGPEPA